LAPPFPGDRGTLSYPLAPAARDRFVLERRGPKHQLDPERACATVWEEELDGAGVLAPTAVIFLTNRECPFRCVMCDLWVDTLDAPVGEGRIPRQIAQALQSLPAARHVKLYNAGSFFDPQAIPPGDYAAIARLVAGFERVIVESHPAFLGGPSGDACLRFRDSLPGRLEVAVGLETAHPAALASLNKRMSLDDFDRAARFLSHNGIALRVFVLLDPPFVPAGEALAWAHQSVRVAAEHGAAVCVVIPTRGGNGAMEALGDAAGVRLGLRDLEAVVERGLSHDGMRTFADLWNVERLFDCECSPRRADRLRELNRAQAIPAAVTCGCDARR